ncbi:hypothetical protein [Parafilimonas sp.]|uniref:hypothetical protein n=1 Tax=Parafilimonas sp. TaxID=1969739 RepID=UPI0039E342F7
MENTEPAEALHYAAYSFAPREKSLNFCKELNFQTASQNHNVKKYFFLKRSKAMLL